MAYAQGFTFEAMSGSALNLPTPLTVSQNGYPDIRFSAHYDTKPFGPFYPYYSWRASFWNQEHDQAWEITQVHHRLFLANNPPEIQFFAIHFGYNFYMFGHAWKRNVSSSQTARSWRGAHGCRSQTDPPRCPTSVSTARRA
jgi:hypothetical protein